MPARVMKVPALAAQPPAGATQTITGTRDSSIAVVMSCIAARLPPGVSSSMTTAASPASSAALIPAAM